MITTREVTYEVDGLQMSGYLARPREEGVWPAVLIAHDGVGLHDYQLRRADDLAQRGYIAFAMDYHGGRSFLGEPEAMLARVLPLLADPGRLQAIGRAALDLILAEPDVDRGRVAGLGYGAGGNILLELVRAGVPFPAVAVVHPDPLAAGVDGWTGATSCILLMTGSEDPICSPEKLSILTQALQDAEVDWRVNIYGGAEHAFWAQPVDPDGSATDGNLHVEATVPGVAYHPAHTVRAWRAVIDLLDETIGASSQPTA